jgi:hypothetical protein
MFCELGGGVDLLYNIMNRYCDCGVFNLYQL